MKKAFILTISFLLFIACKENKPKLYFNKYDETEDIKNQQSHKDITMRYKLIQSKVLDMNEVFKPFQKELKKFSEEEYQKIKPLILEQNIPFIQKSIHEKKITYEQLTLFYLYRIRKFESDSTKSLNAIIALNPNIIKEARKRDRNKKTLPSFSSLYGMPILLKDNINSKEMPTTAGALALLNNKKTNDAFIVEQLKKEGALILGKTNLSEWAYFFCLDCPYGYSSIGGQTLNPYGRKVVETGGSSAGSGAAIAANYAVAAVGTETAGSITSPSSKNSLVGLKPTIGVLSRTGIVPISSTLDTPGPMTKNVIDNLIFLKAMLGFDKNDAEIKKLDKNSYVINKDFTITGKRFGVLTDLLSDSIYKNTIQKLEAYGVEIIEINPTKFNYDGFLTLLNIDMKYDLPKYLKNQGDNSLLVKNVSDVVNFNKKDSLIRAPYGQDMFYGIINDTTSLKELDKIKYRLSSEGREYFKALEEKKLDAILSIDNYHSAISAVAKYPNLSVPMGYKKNGEPVSLTFIGNPFSEKKLLDIGYAFEQITKARKIPKKYK